MGLRETLEAATPGPWEPWEDDLYWKVESVNHGNVANTGRTSWDHAGENARLTALTPELAAEVLELRERHREAMALALDMGEALQASYRGPAGWDENKDALLARFDQLCVREEQA